MEIGYIKEFVVLVETGNYMEAAEKLFISPSALSRHIKSMEEELGTPLFERTARKVHLNTFGAIFLPYAKEISDIQRKYMTSIHNSLKKSPATVTAGSIPMMTQYNITDIMTRFQQENPSYTLNIIEADSTELRNMLEKGQLDFAFVRDISETDNKFTKLPFSVDTLAAVFPSSHPLAELDAVQLEQLKDENLLLLSKDTFMYSLCITKCKQAGFEPKIVFTCHSASKIIDLVARGVGTALLMKKSVAYFSNPDISIVDVKPDITTTISLAYSKTAPLSLAATQYINLVKSL